MLGHHLGLHRLAAFGANFAAFTGVVRGEGADVDVSPSLILFLAVVFMALVALINLRGVAESVKANVVLTCVELSGLLIVIFVGVFAVTEGKADFSRVVMFDTPEDKSIFIAVTAGTSLAFFAMVGFEDSVNMAEETKNPETVFPQDHADRPGHHRRDLHPGLDHRDRPGARW